MIKKIEEGFSFAKSPNFRLKQKNEKCISACFPKLVRKELKLDLTTLLLTRSCFE